MSDALNLKNIIEKESFARSPSLSEDAARQLREMILLEKLPAGTLLPERDLAQALGVSRTPMREAIRILANEGLVSYTPSRRPFVADPSLEEINECLRVQGALESLAGEWACTRATDEEIENIVRLNTSIKMHEIPKSSYRRSASICSSIRQLSPLPEIKRCQPRMQRTMRGSGGFDFYLLSARKVA